MMVCFHDKYKNVFHAVLLHNRDVWPRVVATKSSNQNSRRPRKRWWETKLYFSSPLAFNVIAVCVKTWLLVLFGLLMKMLWSTLQVSLRPCRSFLWQRQTRKPWRTRASASCCANLECEHLQMNRWVIFLVHFTTKMFRLICFSCFNLGMYFAFCLLGDLLEDSSED